MATPTFPGNVPYNWNWSIEADRELHPRVMLRLTTFPAGYDQFIVNPVTDLATGPALLLIPHGVCALRRIGVHHPFSSQQIHRMERLLRVQQSARRFEHTGAVVCAL